MEKGYQVWPHEPGVWKVTGGHADYYVEPEAGRCSCPAYRTCKHLRMVWELEALCPWLIQRETFA